MKRIRTTILSLLVLVAAPVAAQDKVEADASADVVSRYVWRGQDLGHAAIQPSLGVSYKGLSLSAWGSYGITDGSDTDELDLTLSYSTGGLTIGITDYWFSAGDGRYFLYDAHRTSHVFEANLGYDFGPLSINWFTNFAGDDYKCDGKRAYSSYVEVAAPFNLGGLEWNAALGAVPCASSGTYAEVNDFAIVNVALTATKDIKITDKFSLPVFATLAANPCTQKAYLAFGISIK